MYQQLMKSLCVGLMTVAGALSGALGDTTVATFDGTGRVIINEDAVFHRYAGGTGGYSGVDHRAHGR